MLLICRILLIHVYLFASVNLAHNHAFPDAPLTYDVSGSDAWAPYFMLDDQGREYGIMPELTKAIFELAQLQATSVNYPPKRTATSIQQGTLDMDIINPEWISDRQLRDSFVYSDSIIEVKEYYMAKQDFDAERFFTLKNKELQSVGMVRGYYYHNDKDYQRINFPSERVLLEAIDKDRVNVIICDNLTASYWRKANTAPLALLKIHSQGYLKLRMRPELAPIIPHLNRAIAQLHRDGTVNKILAKYQN
jgi:ABC-type amino acid transport substrate-binding protein